MAEVNPMVALDHMQPVRMGMRFLIQPDLLFEVDAVDNQRVASQCPIEFPYHSGSGSFGCCRPSR